MFKKTSKKQPISDKRVTVDATHREKIKYFEALQESLPAKKAEFTTLNQQFRDLQLKIRTRAYKNREDEIFSQRYIVEVEEQVATLQQEIANIEISKEETEYTLNTFEILTKYYSDDTTESKKTLSDAYFEAIGDVVPPARNQGSTQFEERLCPSCGDVYILVDGSFICEQCGTTEHGLIDESVTYKDVQDHNMSIPYTYLKMNHLLELISQFQGKENTTIPQEVYTKFEQELKKLRITDYATITKDIARGILKKNGHSKYFEHIPYILNTLTGITPPQIDAETEQKLKTMFHEIQKPFAKYCNNGRKNILNYNYILYKFFELLELDDFLKYLRLLKSREKLYEHDQIWKSICGELSWSFIPSR